MTEPINHAAVSGERMVRANGIDFCVETFGEPASPAILLLAGAGGSMDYWESAFCDSLAGAGRFVIRYDQRDTGRTVHPADAPPYTLTTLAADALGLLETLGIARTHLVGLSLGGWLAQLIALDHSERVLSLTLIATRPTGFGDGDPDLSGMTTTLGEWFAIERPAPNWADRDAAIAYIVDGERPFVGTLPFDEAGGRAVATRVYDRTTDIAASMAWRNFGDGDERWRERLGAIVAPTLVLHGTADPMFPIGNGEALARAIPGAQLVPLAGMGHEYPPRPLWDTIVAAIVAHTAN